LDRRLTSRDPAAVILAEARAYGIQLAAEGPRLRIGAADGTLTAAFRAKIVAHEPELLAALRGEAEDSDAAYRRAVAVWRAEFLTLFAHAQGYPDEALRVALEVLGRQPAGWDFRVGKDAIVIDMGEGREVRVHRLPQPWLAEDEAR
jgi:hypothetical protein